jgi:hypothetical protein
MPMILNEFLFPLGKLKDLEIVSEELHNSLTNYQNDKSDYELELTNWTYNEILLINGIRKLKEEIQNNIKTNYNVPNIIISQITSSSKTLDDVYEWINEIDYESEWNLISDELLCELFIVFTQLHQSQLMKFYNDNLIVNLKINSNLLRRKLFVKLKTIENQEDKLIFNEFFDYLKEFHSNNVFEEHLEKDESNKRESTFESNNKSIKKTADEKDDENTLDKCYPFQNLEIMNFFRHIEKTTSKKTKIFYSYLREFLILKDMFSDSNLNSQNYYDWINKENNLTGKEKIKYQHNLSSQHDYFKTFESELKHYEKNKTTIPRIE